MRSSEALSQVSPASSERKMPPFSASTMANTRLRWAPEADTPILPMVPLGNPLLVEISVQVSPPSMDLRSPPPGPPLVRLHELRRAAQNDAYRILGSGGSIMRS